MEPALPRPPFPPASAAVALLLATFFSFPLLGMSVQVLNLPLGLWWTEAFLFFAPAWLLARAWNARATGSLGLGRPGLKAVLLGLFAGLCNYPLSASMEAGMRAWFMARWPVFTQASDISALLGHVTGWQRAVFVAAVGLAAPLGEETFFRGLFQRALRAKLGDLGAVALTAVCFGAIHFEPIGLLARVELGLLFGVLALWTGSLWASIAAHAANNLLATTLYYASSKVAEEPAPKPLELLQLAGVGVVLTAPLLVAAWAMRRPEAPSPWAPPDGAGEALRRWALAAFLGVLAIGAVAYLSR